MGENLFIIRDPKQESIPVESYRYKPPASFLRYRLDYSKQSIFVCWFVYSLPQGAQLTFELLWQKAHNNFS